jgi:hypothetical protein
LLELWSTGPRKTKYCGGKLLKDSCKILLITHVCRYKLPLWISIVN